MLKTFKEGLKKIIEFSITHLKVLFADKEDWLTSLEFNYVKP